MEPMEETEQWTTMRVSFRTRDRLSRLALYKDETFDSILNRMIDKAEEK
jgi:hypothetical protein